MSGAKVSLGIDGGASSAKWCLIDQNSNVIKQGALPPIDGHLYRADSLERFRNFLTSVKKQLEFVPYSVVIGITGFGAPENIEKEILRCFPSTNIEMSSDIALAYRSEFNHGEGIYLYAGTGSVAFHLTKENKEVSVGGWGYLLGDEGAGFWIGREAIRHLLLQLEADEKLDALSRKIAENLGGANWRAIRSYVYGKDRSAIAALAPLVSSCASEREPTALSIFEAAASHLADLVFRIREILNNKQLPITFGGGIAETLMSDLLEKKLEVPLRIGNVNHAFTAAKLGLLL
ncbi:MAG: N-acetylglucosamine kinase [Actinomycetota bacterium]